MVMNKKDVISFFDSLAPEWDEKENENSDVINFILDTSGVNKGKQVLDVACGTGVLFDYYFKREVGSLTGIDISGNMIKIAKNKFPDIELICADAELFNFKDKYDVIMIYNAFPHFADPNKLFSNLSCALKNNGRLTVAHGLSEKDLENCHSSVPVGVAAPLPSKERTAQLMSDFFDVDIMISDDEKYIVSGRMK